MGLRSAKVPFVAPSKESKRRSKRNTEETFPLALARLYLFDKIAKIESSAQAGASAQRRPDTVD